MKFLKLITLTIFSFFFLNSSAQEADEFLENVLAVQQGENVFLRWTIKLGNTCDGTRIQRSEDGTGFENIGEIPGVCGSPNQSITYDFTDTLPLLNQINYYRLELGLLGYSSPIWVEVIILNNEGYLVQPNPVKDQATLRFDNPDGDLFEFCLINSQGQIIYNMMTSDDRVELQASLIPAGTYIFKLRKDKQLITRGKVVVI